MRYRYIKFSCVSAIFSVLIVLTSCKSEKTRKPEIRDITAAVFASGHLEPEHQFRLMANADGVILKQLVMEGDVVEAGSVLFEMDDEQQRWQVMASEGNLSLAETQFSANGPLLQQLDQQLQLARLKVEHDSLQERRLAPLVKQGIVSQSEYDNALLQYASSKNAWLTQRQAAAAQKLQLKQQVLNAQSGNVNSRVNDGWLKPKSAGHYRVYKILKQQGELVRKGEVLAVLGDENTMLAKLNIDEENISRIAVGQQVLIQLNTNKDSTLNATISRILPQFDQEQQSFLVEAHFNQPTKGFISGTQLQANVIIGRYEKRLVIPRGLLLKGNKVIAKRDGKSDTLNVQLGVTDAEWTEIVSGISAETELILPR